MNTNAKQHRYRWLLFACAISIALVIGWLAWARVPIFHGDNLEQKRRTRDAISKIEAHVNETQPKKKIKLHVMPSYATSCLRAAPVIPYESCIFIAVEGSTQKEAVDLSNEIVQLIGSNSLSFEKTQSISGIVIQPVVRTSQFTGAVTPYSLDKEFWSGNPLFLKLESQ